MSNTSFLLKMGKNSKTKKLSNIALLFVCTFWVITCKMDNRERCIYNHGLKYWDIIQDFPSNYGYCFYKNGSYVYYYHDSNGKRWEYETDDIVIDRSWKIINDSTIQLGSTLLKIVKLTPDTFIIKRVGGDFIKLKCSNDQIGAIRREENSRPDPLFDTIFVTDPITMKKRIVDTIVYK